MTPVRFYFDYISPNAYIAWIQLHELAARHGRRVEPVPVLFAGLLQAHDLLGPAEVPAKWHWMLRDILRKCARLGIPLAPPCRHPFNPLLALRVSSLPMDDDRRRTLIDAIFRAVWVESRDPADPETIGALAGDDLLAAADEPQNKLRLRRQTEAAIARGVFGVPTMIADDSLFWGFDDFAHLEALLAGRDRLDTIAGDCIQSWCAVPRGATRRPARGRTP